MNSKHTPGPWSYRESATTKGKFFIETQYSSISTIFNEDLNPEANARLIAQSPDLFDLAENLLIVLEYPCGSEAQIRCLEEVAQAARDIITKVKGQTCLTTA